MIYKESLDRARPQLRKVSKPTFVGAVTDLFSGDALSGPRPQSFLVEQSANWTLPTHFHLQYQFQVFTGGSGFLGKNVIEPLTVHFASRHSGYGPLISGDDGISYFTLRAMSDEGAWYLPESREHLLVRIKKQQAHAHPSTYIALEELKASTETYSEVLLPMDAGGLAAWLYRLPPNTKIPAPAGHNAGGGRFHVVSKGSARVGDASMPGWSTIFVSNDETLDIESGAEGLEMLVLQFPLAALRLSE